MATAAVLYAGGDGGAAPAYLNAYRPWMAMYGVRLQRAAQKAKQGEMSLIEKALPEEMLLHVFQFLPIHSLAAAQIVCRQWRSVGAAPCLWRAACMDAFFTSTVEQNADLVRRQYRGCWKRMLLERPHLRFDGVYVSRNTYLRQGIVEWNVKNAVHLVLYFRYMRFYPDGTFAYRTSPEPLARVHRSLAQAYAARHRGGGGGGGGARRDAASDVHLGRFKQEGERVFTAMRYLPHSATEIRSRLRLRSTLPGANNRLDIQAIMSWDRADGKAVPMMDLQPDEEAAEGADARQHQRGMSAYVFVPFEQFQCHAINLPISEMDVFLPG